MTNTQKTNLQKLVDAINATEYNEGRDEFKGFKGCTMSDMQILIDWVNQLIRNGRVYSIEFEQPMKIMKKYGLTDLVEC